HLGREPEPPTGGAAARWGDGRGGPRWKPPPITAGGGRIQASAATLQSLQLGGAKIDNAAVVVADFFTILNAVVGAKLEGIVGYNFLRNYKVVVDYPRERLTLF